MQDRDGIEEITALPTTSKTLLSRVEALKPSESLPARPSMKLNDKEIASANPPHTIRYVIVGYTYAGIVKEEARYSQQPHFVPSATAVGFKSPDDKDVLSFEDAEEPTLYVVARIFTNKDQKKGGLVLSALIPEHSGLSRPYNIKQELVFYRSEFRDNNKSNRNRKKSWNEMISAHCCQFSHDAALDRKHQNYRRAQDTGKVIVEPFESLLANLNIHMSVFRVAPAAYLLHEMKTALERADVDLLSKPYFEHDSLVAFVDKTFEEFLEEEDAADSLITEAQSLWPEMQDLDPARVLLLKECFELAEVELSYYMLPGLLGEGMARLVQEESEENGVVKEKLGGEVFKTVQRVMGPSERKSAGPILEDEGSGSKERALLRAILPFLRQVLAAHDTNMKKSKDVFGDAAMLDYESIPEIWSTYKDQVDQDSARVVFSETVRFAVATALDNYTKGYMVPLEKLIEMMEKANLG